MMHILGIVQRVGIGDNVDNKKLWVFLNRNKKFREENFWGSCFLKKQILI
jgi:hypothetical protein